MSLIRSWFDFKNQFKRNVKSSFEQDVKTTSLDEFYKTHKTLISSIAMIMISSVLAVPLIYVGISNSSVWHDPLWWFILFVLFILEEMFFMWL